MFGARALQKVGIFPTLRQAKLSAQLRCFPPLSLQLCRWLRSTDGSYRVVGLHVQWMQKKKSDIIHRSWWAKWGPSGLMCLIKFWKKKKKHSTSTSSAPVYPQGRCLRLFRTSLIDCTNGTIHRDKVVLNARCYMQPSEVLFTYAPSLYVNSKVVFLLH